MVSLGLSSTGNVPDMEASSWENNSNSNYLINPLGDVAVTLIQLISSIPIWICGQVNATRLHWWLVIIGSVMTWSRQTTSHYPNQCWPRSVTAYGVTSHYVLKPTQEWDRVCILAFIDNIETWFHAENVSFWWRHHVQPSPTFILTVLSVVSSINAKFVDESILCRKNTSVCSVFSTTRTIMSNKTEKKIGAIDTNGLRAPK